MESPSFIGNIFNLFIYLPLIYFIVNIYNIKNELIFNIRIIGPAIFSRR